MAPIVRGRGDVLRNANAEKEAFSHRATEFGAVLNSSSVTSEMSVVQVKERLRALQELQTSFVELLNGNVTVIISHGLKDDALYLIQIIDVWTALTPLFFTYYLDRRWVNNGVLSIQPHYRR